MTPLIALLIASWLTSGFGAWGCVMLRYDIGNGVRAGDWFALVMCLTLGPFMWFLLLLNLTFNRIFEGSWT